MGVTRTQASTIDTSVVSGPEVFHAGLDDDAGSLGLPMGQAERVSANLGIPTLGRTVAVFKKEATTWYGTSGESLPSLELDKLALDTEIRCAVIKPDFTDLACWSEDPDLIVTLDKTTRRALDNALGAADEVHGQSYDPHGPNYPVASSISDLVPAPGTPLEEVAGDGNDEEEPEEANLEPDVDDSDAEREPVGFEPTPTQRKDLQLAHENAGHPSAKDFARMLRRGSCKPEIASWVAKHFKCPECESNRRPKARRPTAVPKSYRFNHVVGIDLVFKKWEGYPMAELHMLGRGTADGLPTHG